MNWSTILTFAIPPLAGTIIGYFTNDIAINMLFRPYKAIYIGKRRLPFTPGLIPRNQERLAKRVSDTIMGSLLTPEELQNLARRLLATERVEAAILWLLNLGIEQLREDKEEKTAKLLANVLEDLFDKSLPRLIKVFARREDFLKEQIDQIFDRVLLEFQLNDERAKQLSDWLLQVVLPPNTIRLIIIDFLSDRNIQILDDTIKQKSSGTVWVVANVLGLRNSLLRLRSFCLDEKEVANARIQELILSLEARNRLRNWLQSLSLQNLPVSTVRQLRKTIRDTVRSYVQEKGADLIQELGQSIDWKKISVLLINRLQSSEMLLSSLGVVSQELALVFERYLERDLEVIVAKVIPILSIDQVIIDRVNATSPQDLESAIQGIVKSELQAIVNLGGFLGFLVGCLQVVFFIFR